MRWSIALILTGGLMSGLLPANARAAWHLEKHNAATQVYTRNVAGSEAKAVRAVTTVNAGVIQLANFLQDPGTHSRWVPHSRSVAIVERKSPDTTLVHFVMQSSWPFQARDAVAQFQLRQAPPSEIWIAFNSQPDRLPAMKNTVRLRQYTGCWRLTAQAAESTRVEYRSHIDAGGSVPAWLANSVAVRTTFDAMENLRQQVSAYEIPPGTPLAFLRNPAGYAPDRATIAFDEGCALPFPPVKKTAP